MYFMYRCGTTSKICQVKKSKEQQSELPVCTEGVGGDTRPLVFIYGSGLKAPLLLRLHLDQLFPLCSGSLRIDSFLEPTSPFSKQGLQGLICFR